jgi:xylitol oxidase
VSLFLDWQQERVNQVWVKALAGKPHVDLTRLGASRAAGPVHPIPGTDPAACTQQGGVPGPWHERLPHFRLDHVPSAGDELQAEYIVPRDRFLEAFALVSELREQIRDVIQITEIRTIAADGFWMSPAFGRPSVGIHFTLRPDRSRVEALLPEVERRLKPLGARPHWGKLFTMSAADLQEQYPKMEDFRRLLAKFDPTGKFRNPFLDRTVG